MPVAGLMAAIHLLMSSYLSDVRTTGTGRVCQPHVRRRDEKEKNEFLTLNSNMGQREGLALPLRSRKVPENRSSPSSRPAGNFCDGLSQTLARPDATGA